MILKQLQEEHRRNDSKIKEIGRRIANAPKGTLRITGTRARKLYYHRKDVHDKYGTYIPVSDSILPRKLVQRSYDEKNLRILLKEKTLLEELISCLEENPRGLLYEKMTEDRRNLLDVYDVSDREYAKQWQAVQYSGREWRDNEEGITTARGDLVRSKSEMIIADRLFLAGIPYRYEYPMRLENGMTIYPDFTILNIRTREEIIFEHFGRMDDQTYVKSFVWKITQYCRNGFILGRNLFASFEGFGYLFDTRMIDRIVELVK